MWLDYDDYTGEVWDKPVPTIKRFWFAHDDSGDSKCLTISTIRAMKRFWLNQILLSIQLNSIERSARFNKLRWSRKIYMSIGFHRMQENLISMLVRYRTISISPKCTLRVERMSDSWRNARFRNDEVNSKWRKFIRMVFDRSDH